MAVKSALTVSEINSLSANGHTVSCYLAPPLLTVVATALVNQSQFGFPVAQITIDNTSAGWGNIKIGMTVHIAGYGYFRIRKLPTSSILYLQELGTGGSGVSLVPSSINTSTIPSDNAVITVYDRYDIWSVLPRIDFETGTIYEDYDLTVGTFNTSPPPIVNISINNTGGHYATKIADNETVLISCVATVYHWVGSSATYSWTYPASWTSVSGASSSTLTGTAPAGNYSVSLTVTSNTGAVFTATRFIWVCDDTTNPPISIPYPESDNRDRMGRKLSISFPDTDASTLTLGSMVHYFEVASWNGTNVSSASTQFTGWVRGRNYEQTGNLQGSTWQIVSPSFLLEEIESQSVYFEANNAPSKWSELLPALCSESFLAWWLLNQRSGNIARLFNFTVSSLAAAGQRLPAWQIDKGTLLSQLNKLATEIGNFGCNSSGEFFFLKHPSFIAYASRTNVPIRDTLTSALWSAYSLQVKEFYDISQVRGEAFSWDGSAVNPVPYLADAPSSGGQGKSTQKLSGMIVDSQATLNQIVGDYHAYLNNPYPDLTITIPGNRDVYEPAEMYFISVSVSASESADNVGWTRKGVLISVDKKIEKDGAVSIALKMELETSGAAGITIEVPIPNPNIFTPPEYPPITYPPIEIYPPIIPITPPVITKPNEPSVPTDGNSILLCESGALYTTINALSNSVTWVDITPTDLGSFEIQQAIHDPQNDFHRGAYLLASDGTNSKIWYTSDVYATTVSWTGGTAYAGNYRKIEGVKGAGGKVVVYQPNSISYSTPGSVTIDFDGAYSNYSTNGTEGSGGNPGNKVSKSGGIGVNNYSSGLMITINFSWGATVTNVNYQFKTTPSGYFHRRRIRLYDQFNTVIYESDLSTPFGATGWSNNNWATGTVTGVYKVTIEMTGVTAAPATAIDVDNVAVEGNIGSVGTAKIAYSEDYGVTFQTPVSLGVGVETGAFSLGRFGKSSLGGAQEIVYLAEGYNESYSSYILFSGQSPRGILIPWFKIGSNVDTNYGTIPNFIYGTTAAYNSHYLHLDTGTHTGISPSGTTYPISRFALASWKGTQLFALLEKSGATHLYTGTLTSTAWTATDRGAVTGAISINILRMSGVTNLSSRKFIFACGSAGLKYSGDGGATITTLTPPSNETVIYAEFFG